MLQAENLCKVFQASRGRRIEAVRQASFSVTEGSVLGVLGPNGAGKTTLLRMLGAIVRPTGGRCLLNGRDISENADIIRHQIGFLSGNTRLYGRLTAWEVLRYFGRLYGMSAGRISRRVEETAAALDMTELLSRRCETLSTGQTQKVSIARVLLHDPYLLILDEPTLGLDIITSGTILALISEARSRGRIIVYATHSMSEAESLCDQVALIHQGLIPAMGTARELCETTGQPDLRHAFLHVIGGKNVS